MSVHKAVTGVLLWVLFNEEDAELFGSVQTCMSYAESMFGIKHDDWKPDQRLNWIYVSKPSIRIEMWDCTVTLHKRI